MKNKENKKILEAINKLVSAKTTFVRASSRPLDHFFITRDGKNYFTIQIDLIVEEKHMNEYHNAINAMFEKK